VIESARLETGKMRQEREWAGLTGLARLSRQDCSMSLDVLSFILSILLILSILPLLDLASR
jgi:hypothetical protein